MGATHITLIINVFSTLYMSMGIFTGPLLKLYGYRKVALAGGFTFSAGLFITSMAFSFPHFIISYSIIAGNMEVFLSLHILYIWFSAMGNSFIVASFSLALNTYFKEKRNKAAGIAITITGLGPIIYPGLIIFLIKYYGTTGCALILAAVSMNIVVAALLLQPIKYHMQTVLDSKVEEINC